MKKIVFGFLVISSSCFAQLLTLPVTTYYRDLSLSSDSAPKNPFSYTGDAYFPAHLGQIDLYNKYHDPSTTFTDFEETLLKKHILEIKENDVVLNASPVGEFSFGSDLLDTNGFDLFQNTRGIFIEGQFFEDFSFQTSFYENQIRVSSYESDFIQDHGELYTRPWGYEQQNGVVPGGARTKPFKDGGFDYAFAFGHFLYAPSPYFTILAGNSPQFIGSGYRSMLYSNNFPNVPFIKLSAQISPKLSYSVARIRGMNLVRKKISSSVESYYQPKAMGIHYLHWSPNQNIGIQFFEGSIWKMGDSLKSGPPNPFYWCPTPLLALIDKNNTNTVFGLDLNCILSPHFRLYGQVATNRSFEEFALQGGIRAYFSHLMMQFELNKASSAMYRSENAALNYSNYNLPIAHIKGNSFTELLTRGSYTYKKFYAEVKNVLYFLENHQANTLIPVNLPSSINSGLLNHLSSEIGYRFNIKLNISLYSRLTWRKSFTENQDNNLLFHIGIRTGLLDRCDDF